VNKTSSGQTLLQLTSGYWVSHAIYIVAKLGIADLLKDGSRSCKELVIPAGNAPSFAKLLDLHMLVVTGGRQRTEAEYRTLLGSAGLRLTNVVPTESGESVIEAVCA